MASGFIGGTMRTPLGSPNPPVFVEALVYSLLIFLLAVIVGVIP